MPQAVVAGEWRGKCPYLEGAGKGKALLSKGGCEWNGAATMM